MKLPRFIQIHFLAGWPGSLLNRDDAGLAKRLPFGSVTRTRVSSQCLKRHWRTGGDIHLPHPMALHEIAGDQASVRTKEAIERLVIKPLAGSFDAGILKAVETVFIEKVYGAKAGDMKARQALLLGYPEIAYLKDNAARIAGEAADAKDAKTQAEAWFKGGDEKANLKQLAEQKGFSAGLEAALFGRMVTSDTRANTDAAIHVAHAFTVHDEQPELDYFTVVDDLKNKADGDDSGSAGIFDTELTSGLYYGYVVVDVPLLVSNLTGCPRRDWAGDHDRELAAKAIESLVHLIADVSPGAKKGSTAPYSRAEMILVEAGERQPRTLANAFREPVSLTGNSSLGQRTAMALTAELTDIDRMYGDHELRKHAARSHARIEGIDSVTVAQLADWTGNLVRTAACA